MRSGLLLDPRIHLILLALVVGASWWAARRDDDDPTGVMLCGPVSDCCPDGAGCDYCAVLRAERGAGAVVIRVGGSPAPRRADLMPWGNETAPPKRFGGAARRHGGSKMAKRRSTAAPEGDRIKTSVALARATHARLSALASLRGCSLNAILAEVADEAARQIVIVDKRKSADRGDLPVQGIGSADEAA